MKNILIAFAFLFSLNAVAGGKITVEPRYYLDQRQVGGIISLGIYQPLLAGVALDTWIATGRSANQQAVLDNWARGKLDLKKQLHEQFTLGIGVGADCSYAPGSMSPDVHTSMEFKLW